MTNKMNARMYLKFLSMKLSNLFLPEIIAVQNPSSRENEYLFQGKRKQLILQLSKKGIQNKNVLNAIGKIPRHLFFDYNTFLPALLDHELLAPSRPQ